MKMRIAKVLAQVFLPGRRFSMRSDLGNALSEHRGLRPKAFY
jgi:hypothetical protein